MSTRTILHLPQDCHPVLPELRSGQSTEMVLRTLQDREQEFSLASPCYRTTSGLVIRARAEVPRSLGASRLDAPSGGSSPPIALPAALGGFCSAWRAARRSTPQTEVSDDTNPGGRSAGELLSQETPSLTSLPPVHAASSHSNTPRQKHSACAGCST
eukprot:600231-Hanusia_phi.AAC.2